MKKIILMSIFLSTLLLQAKTIQCPVPPTSINPEVISKVNFDKKTGMYKYQYTIKNKSDSKLPISDWRLKTFGDVQNAKSPAFWEYLGFLKETNKISWSNIGITDNKDILPGASLSGFEFTSPNHPGIIKFYAVGMPNSLPTVIADNPGDSEDEADFSCPGFFQDGFESDVTLATTGPLPPNQVDVKLRIKKSNAKKWFGKNDADAELEISPLDKDKIQIILFDDKDVDTSKINLATLEFGFGKAKPTKTFFVKDFKDDFDSEIKDHVKKHTASNLMMEFNLVDVNVRCDIDRYLFLSGKIDSRNLFGAVKIKHSACDAKNFNKHPDKK